MPSLPPFVHDFPYQDNAVLIVRPGKIEIPIVLIVRVIILRTVTSTSSAPSLSVLPVNLPPSVPTCLGVTVSTLVYCRHQQRSTTGQVGLSLGKTQHLPIFRPASCQFDTSGYQVSPILVCLTFSPTPYSRFAVRYVHRFCLMLPPGPQLPVAPLPCWRRPSVRKTADHKCSSYFAGTAALASCQAHKDPYAERRGLGRPQRGPVCLAVKDG